jgi:putative NADH-flavin reductase
VKNVGNETLKLTVFGASGGIGRHVVRQAVAAGQHVTAVVRDPAKLADLQHPHLDIVTADVTSPESIAMTLVGRDAVVSALGPRPGGPVTICSAGIRSIIEAMQSAGIRRLVAVDASGRVTDAGDGIITRTIAKPLLRRLLRDAFADLARVEGMVRASGLEWTLMRPPRLTDKPRTGRYRTAIDLNVRGGVLVARADVADGILAALADPATIGHTVGIAL